MALINKLTAIADAIREKTGDEEELSLDDMVTAIEGIETGGGGGGASIPNLVFNSLDYVNYRGRYDWLFEDYLNKISTQNVRSCLYMFTDSQVEDLSDLTINFDTSDSIDWRYMLYGAKKLKQLPKIGTALNNNISSPGVSLFYNCQCLREIPSDYVSKIPYSAFVSNTSFNFLTGLFNSCYSLREIPSSIMSNLKNNTTSTSLGYKSTFASCYCLNEIRNLPCYKDGTTSYITRNIFDNSFGYCNRLKNLIFETDNGDPLVKTWRGQVIDLTNYVGYAYVVEAVTGYNSGITSAKRVTDAASYATLKNDPDWFTTDVAYSRYNHDSAVATINSLPDTSSYSSSNPNIIKFIGSAGSATDGGAISTLTNAEIAVATEKGWTVSLY